MTLHTIGVDNWSSTVVFGENVQSVPSAVQTGVLSATLDGATYSGFDIAELSEATEIPAVTDPVKGKVYVFRFLQPHVTGEYNVTWNAQYTFTTAFSNTGNTIDTATTSTFVYDGAKMVGIGGNAWA
jgi:hypothetical protein